MKKKFFLIVILLISCLVSSNATYANESIPKKVVAQKVWSIHLSADVLNTEENLNKIYIVNSFNEKIDSLVRTQGIKWNVIEIIPTEDLPYGEYKIVIESGFQSANKKELGELVQKKFVVDSTVSSEYLNGIWETHYTYLGEEYKISSTHVDGKAEVIAYTAAGGFFGEGMYTLTNGYMEMKLSELPSQFENKLNGQLKVYNDKKYIIFSENGREATFLKK